MSDTNHDSFHDYEYIFDVSANEWIQVSLPFAGDVKELIRVDNDIVAHGVNGKKAISKDFGLTWKPYRERHKFRRYKSRHKMNYCKKQPRLV